MAAGRQAFEIAAALGDSAVQGRAAYTLGLIYYAIGDFCRAAEILRLNVEASNGEVDWNPDAVLPGAQKVALLGVKGDALTRRVAQLLGESDVRKVIVVTGRLLNFVTA